MLKLINLKAGRWDELEARSYLQLVQWAAQRIRSIDREEYPLFVRMCVWKNALMTAISLT